MHPKPPDHYILQFLLVLLQNHISQCRFFSLLLLFFHLLDRVFFMASCLQVIKVCFIESIVKYVQGWVSIERKVSRWLLEADMLAQFKIQKQHS